MAKRACDACAVRKIRCGGTKPCFHCVQNHLKCTVLRERKKCGPKNIQRKTLETIDKLVDSKTPEEEITNGEVVEILSLLESPQLEEIVEASTVSLVLVNIEEFKIEALNDRKSKSASQIGKQAVAYSLALCILEILNIISEFPSDHQIFTFTISQKYQGLQPQLLVQTQKLLLALEFELRLTPSNPDIEILYNNSLSCAHVYTYYRLACINPAKSRIARFLHLRQAIMCLQLLEAETSVSNSHKKILDLQLFELHEYLYSLERLNYFIHDNGVVSPPVLHDNVNLEATKQLDLRNQLFILLKTLKPFLSIFRFLDFNQILSENFNMNDFIILCKRKDVTPILLEGLFHQLQDCESKSNTVYLLYMLIFNTLIAFQLEMAISILKTNQFLSSSRTLHHISRINLIFQGTDVAILAVRSVHSQFIPQFLVMLQRCGGYDLLLLTRKILGEFSKNILDLSPQGRLIDPYVRQLPSLQRWFVELSESNLNLNSAQRDVPTSNGLSQIATAQNLEPPTVPGLVISGPTSYLSINESRNMNIDAIELKRHLTSPLAMGLQLDSLTNTINVATPVTQVELEFLQQQSVEQPSTLEIQRESISDLFLYFQNTKPLAE